MPESLMAVADAYQWTIIFGATRHTCHWLSRSLLLLRMDVLNHTFFIYQIFLYHQRSISVSDLLCSMILFCNTAEGTYKSGVTLSCYIDKVFQLWCKGVCCEKVKELAFDLEKSDHIDFYAHRTLYLLIPASVNSFCINLRPSSRFHYIDP